MQRARRFSRIACLVVIGAACLVAVAGCGEGSSLGDDHDHDHEHAGHVIPAHKPRTFPDAVRRLRELNGQLARGTGPGKSTEVSGHGTLDIALDIANWLPEIAADSDMPKEPWDAVNDRSAALVSDYRTILAGAGADQKDQSVNHASTVISDLEKIVTAADPKWFAVPEKRHDEPEPVPAATAVLAP